EAIAAFCVENEIYLQAIARISRLQEIAGDALPFGWVVGKPLGIANKSEILVFLLAKFVANLGYFAAVVDMRAIGLAEGLAFFACLGRPLPKGAPDFLILIAELVAVAVVPTQFLPTVGVLAPQGTVFTGQVRRWIALQVEAFQQCLPLWVVLG